MPVAVELPIAAIVLLDEGETSLQSLSHLGSDAALSKLIGRTSRL